MNNKEFKKLRAKKNAQTIKEEFMICKQNNLTDKQLEAVCNDGPGHGCIVFGKSMSVEEMAKRRDKLMESKKNNKSSKSLIDIFNKIAKGFK